MGGPLKSLVGQTAIYGMSSIVGRFLNYLLVPLYTNLFLTDEYGVVSEFYAYVSILLVLLTYGMETGFFRFMQNEKYNKDSVFSTSLLSLTFTSVLFCLIIVAFGKPISFSIGYSANIEYVVLLGLTVALDALSAIPFALLRNKNKALRFATIKFINIGLNIGFNLFFLVFVPFALGNDNFIFNTFYPKLDVGYIFISNFMSSFITLLLLAPEIKQGYKFSAFDFSLLKDLLKYSYPLLFAGLAGMMSENFDRILIKYLTVVPDGILDPDKFVMSQVGIYGANVKIAVLMTLFIQAYRYAAEPFFFSYAGKQDSKLMYAKVMNYFIAFCVFIFLGIMLFIDFTKYIIDSSYHEGLSIVPILLIGKIIFGIAFNLSIWYKLTNKTGFGAALAFIEVFFSISLNIILIPVVGYYGAAWAAFGAYVAMMLVSLFLGNRYFPVPYQYYKILSYFALAIIIYVLNLFLRNITDYYLFWNFLFLVFYAYIFTTIEKINVRNVIYGLIKKK